MVALPILALARPVQTGAFQTLYPYYLLNTLPPQLVGLGLLLDQLWTRARVAAAGLIGVIVAAHLALAVPFFFTQEEYWPRGDYGVPWHFQAELARDLEMRARAASAFVFVGGDEQDHSQHRLLAQILSRTYPDVRTFDGHDGLVFRTDSPANLVVTTNEEHLLTHWLRATFPQQEVAAQTLPGAGWVRRVFHLEPAALATWADTHLPPPLDAETSLVTYERLGLVPAVVPGGPPAIGALWRFEADPPEPFLTRYEVFRGTERLHREEHVSYPASSWERGDWLGTRMLNLIQLTDVRPIAGDVVRLSHVHVLSGKAVAPPIEFTVAAS
jgi:hypothetical protein